MSTATVTFDRMPQASNLQALRTLSRKPGADPKLPPLSAEVKKVRADARHLRRYTEICGFTQLDRLPIPYPQVLAVGLQMRVMTRPEFPIPLLGMVHVRNVIEQVRPLAADETFGVAVSTENGRRTERGFEFDLVTRCRARDGEIWRATASILHRIARPDGGRRKPAEPEPAAISDYILIDAPSGIGRRYGRIAGDMNPIHLYPLTAKLFGFPRHIAHGMWSLARCCATLEPGLGLPPREVDVTFRNPLFLPGRAALRSAREGERIAFTLLGRDSGKVHLNGTLR